MKHASSLLHNILTRMNKSTYSHQRNHVNTYTRKHLQKGLLLLTALLFSLCYAHAQGELWGVSLQGGLIGAGNIYKVDGSNPSLANLAQKFSFNSVNGSQPTSAPLLCSNGKLYGTTNTGGSAGFGVLYEYDPGTNVYTKKVDFNASGRLPYQLTLDANGKFYGLARSGGSANGGVLFEYDHVTNTYTVKYNFIAATGSFPHSGLTLAGNGKYYGITSGGGVFNQGVLFEYDVATNTYTKKFDLNGTTDGQQFNGNLALGGNGKLYGTTYGGGSAGLGILFEYDPATNTYTKKIDFSIAITGGYWPTAGPTLAANGKFYGLTFAGGANSFGTLFEYDYTTNTYTTKFDFTPATGGYNGLGNVLTLSPNGKLYGATEAGDFASNIGGVLFEYDPATNALTNKIEFDITAATSYVNYTTGKFFYVQSQAITGFAAIPNKAFGDAPFNVSATAGASGNPVTFSSSNPAVATMSGNTVTIVGGGTVTINAYQAGTTTYLAAGASQTFTVNKAAQTITFGALAAKTFGDASFALTSTASSGLAVTYASNNPAVATVSGSTVTIVGAGTTTITASQPGNANYLAATDVPQALTVNKQTQTITFSVLAAKTYGDAAFNLSATGGTSGNPITFVSSNTAVATVSGNTVTIVGAGTTTITASQAGNANHNAAADVPQTLTVNKQNQVITFGALSAKTFGDIPFTVSATGGTSGNAITFSSSNTSVATVSGNVVTIVGAGTTNIIASQAGNANYNAAADVPQTLAVNKAAQAISFSALTTRTMGDAPFVLTATGGASGNPVTFVSSNTSVATVLGNVVTIVGAGTTTITASQAGNTNYSAAPDIPQLLTVNKGNQTITFGALSSKTFGDTPFSLTGTASSGLAVSYVSSNTGVATISGSTLTIVGAGSTTITASQAGNVSYNAATDVPQTLTVNKANQTITFNALPTKTVGDAPFSLTATASSGLPVTYFSSNSLVATVSGSTVTIVGGGTATIGVTRSGNSNYNSATPTAQILTVNRLNQSIIFNALPEKNVGDAPFSLTATASSGLPVTYFSSNPSVATISGSTLTIVGGGSATINAVQGGNDSYNSATTAAVPLIVNRLYQAISFLDLSTKTVSDASFSLTATASSGLPVSYSSNNPSVATISGSTVTIVGAGTVTITATQAGNASFNLATPASRLLTVTKLNQIITFSDLASKTVGDAAFNLTATADSGLPVSFTSSNASVATISGSTVTIVGAGTAVITASQPGNTNYTIAATVSQALTVNKANQTITFDAIPDKIVSDGAFDLAATSTSGLPVTYVSSDPMVATVSGNTVSLLRSGLTIITASQSGNGNFNAALTLSRTLNVNKYNQTITFNVLANKVLGDADFALTATVSSGSIVPITYTSSNIGVATISDNTVTIVGTGTTIITASHPGDPIFNAATPVSQSLTVTAGSKADQTISFNPVPEQYFGDGSFNLSATASSGLPVTYMSSDETVATISGNTVTLVGGGLTIITASQSGNASYNPAVDVTRALKVNVGNQDITFGALPVKTFGDAPFTVAATSISGLPVSYFCSNPSVAVVSDNLVTILGAGTATITAWQGGDRNYDAANNVDQPLVVNKAAQTIIFNALSGKNVGDAAFDLAGVASSALSVSYTSSNTSVATVSGCTVTIVGAGTTIITASQPGDVNYNAATSVSQIIKVKKTTQTITFDALSDRTTDDAAFNLTATASSGLAVIYVSSNTSVATVSGSTVTIIGTGTTIITASQSGNANFYAAAGVSRILTVTSSANKVNQTITFNTLVDRTAGDTPFALSAISSSGLAVGFSTTSNKITISGNQATIVSAGRASIIATQAGNASFNAATSVERSFCIKPAKPIVTLSNSNTEFPKLTSSAATGNQWFLNGIAITGAIGTTLDVTEEGAYKVQVRVDDCVSEFSNDQVMIVTGNAESNTNSFQEIYPNPATDWITVTLEDAGKKEVALFDFAGKKTSSQSTSGDAAKFYVADYAAGVYLVKVTTNNAVKTMRFVKK